MATDQDLNNADIGDSLDEEEKIRRAAEEAGIDVEKYRADEARKKAAKGFLKNEDTHEKPLQKSASAGATLSKQEAENVIQAFGRRVIDWRRMTDTEAGAEMTRIVNNIGVDAFWRSIARTREIIAKPRLLALSAICSLGLPEVPNLIKNPPDVDDDELWRMAFQAFILDERRREDDAIRRRMLDQATDEQARA